MHHHTLVFINPVEAYMFTAIAPPEGKHDVMKDQDGGLLPLSPNYSSFDENKDKLEKVKMTRTVMDFDMEDPSHKNEDVAGVLPLPRTNQVFFEYLSGRAVPRLREPHHLYGVSGHVSQTLPRWPLECEVILGDVFHVEWTPPIPEPLHAKVNTSYWLRSQEEAEGTVVYNTEGVKDNYFSGSRVGRGCLSSPSPAAVSLSGPDDTTLLFEGRFESGNLLKAVKLGEFNYELSLRTDLYTEKHTQWFYFRVQNTRARVQYRFTITNLLKEKSLYEEGQLPLLYSVEKAKLHGVGWHRVGQEVSYYRNGRQHSGQPCYSLAWTFLFPYGQDTCYFAHCYPYTYSNLWTYISEIERDPRRSHFCKVRTLCRSLAGNLVPVLTVTNPFRSVEKDGTNKPAVVVTARIHPGETNSSWVMKGILNFLLGNSPDATLLRNTFVFKLVPMLNPDGVIVGNYRCSLTGRDLNRNYKSILRDSFPTICAIRTMVQRLSEERQVLFYCDLHGHSRKQNAFIYGCENSRLTDRHLHERVFPLMLSKNCPDMFSFQSCKFKVQRSKEGTGRVAFWRLGVLNSFTLETSFGGSSIGKRKGTHFSTKDLEMLGAHFCDTLLDYCDPDRSKYSVCVRELHEMVRQPAGWPVNAEPKDASLCDVSTSDCNSSDSDEPPVHRQTFSKLARLKKLKSKKERNMSCLSQARVVQERRENNVKDTLEKGNRLKPLKASTGRLSKWKDRQLPVLESSQPDKKSEYVQHIMEDYVRSQMHLTPRQTFNGYDCGFTNSPRASRLPSHCVPSYLRPTLPPSQLPQDLRSRPNRLPGLAEFAAEDMTIGRLSPVQWRSVKSFTAPENLQVKSNSEGKRSKVQNQQCKCRLWHGIGCERQEPIKED